MATKNKEAPMSDIMLATGELPSLKDRGQIVCKFDHVDAGRMALVVIDMQDAFVDPRYGIAAPGAAALIPPINSLAATLRAAGGRVVFTRHAVSDEPPFALPPWLRDSAIIRELARLFTPGNPGY